MKYYSEESIRLWQRDFDSSLDDYPCIEIKEPHGRLIDADVLKKHMTDLLRHDYVFDEVGCFGLVRDAPTVLEASDNNDDDHSYEMQSDMRDYCERYEPTYNPEDGSM